MTDKKILIIEDEASLAQPLEAKLLTKGFTVYSAEDGQNGLEIALQEHPDLILLDILMPRKDGIEMLKELRKDSWGANAKVVILTNLTSEKASKQAEDLNVTDYLIKSDWSINKLLEIVDERLEK